MATTKHRITITLDDEDYERLVRISNKFGKSLSWIAGYAIKGLTKEVGERQFKVFKAWASKRASDGVRTNISELER